MSRRFLHRGVIAEHAAELVDRHGRADEGEDAADEEYPVVAQRLTLGFVAHRVDHVGIAAGRVWSRWRGCQVQSHNRRGWPAEQ